MLHSGAQIAIVAPAGVPHTKRLAAATELIRSWGWVPVLAPNIGAQHRYAAGTAAQRGADLNWALSAPDIDAVWFARGGYGTVHTLPHLPAQLPDSRPVIGFSDATALLGTLTNRGALAIHGPVLETLVADSSSTTLLPAIDDNSLNALRNLLVSGARPRLPGRLVAGSPSSVTAPVLGGNLSVLTSLIGTPWQLQLDGATLVLEDTNERPYRLDRLATQLMDSGSLRCLKAIALGTFDRCTKPSEDSAEEILAELFAPLGIPILAGLPVGHGTSNVA